LVKTDWQYDDIVTEVDLNQMGTEINANTDKVADNLDSKPWTPITLNNGVQIVQGGDVPAILHPEFSGRTLVNRVGCDGGMESISPFATYGITPVLSTTQKRSGASSVKIIPSGSEPSYVYKDYDYKLDISKNYVLLAWVFLESYTSGGTSLSLTIYDKGDLSITRYAEILDTTKVGKWQLVYVKIPTANSITSDGFRLLVGAGSSGISVSYFDEVRLYEVSTMDYAAIGTTIIGEAIDKFLPYVDDMKHVNGVWMENKGKQLFPEFSGWSEIVSGSYAITSPYKAYAVLTSTSQNIASPNISVVAGQTYTLSFDVSSANLKYLYRCLDASGAFLLDSGWITTNPSVTFTAPVGSVSFTIVFGNSTGVTMNIDNPMLNIGSEALPFEPQKPSYLYLPSVQLKSSVDGSVKDELYSDGQGKPRVTHRFKEIELNGSFPWVYAHDGIGFKGVYVAKSSIGDYVSGSGCMVKYDGKVMRNTDDTIFGGTNAGADMFYLREVTFSRAYINIYDTDSGWGETYTPTVDEIKSYFMGWEMGTWDGLFTKGYNGTGTKAWRPIGDTHPTARGVVTLPTQELTEAEKVISTFKHPYRLMYQLAASVDEAVKYEGSLMLHEGANQIEVGTGIVVREATKIYSNDSAQYINATAAGFGLSKRVNKFVDVYRNGTVDKTWKYFSVTAIGQAQIGNGQLRSNIADYDPTSAYSATYLALDTYSLGIAPQTINAKYAPNIRESVESLVREVVETRTQISVLQNTKAQKQQSEWITPTMLNGWVNVGGLAQTVGYYKDGNGIVRIKGIIKMGTALAGTVLFMLPEGYRPEGNITVVGVSNADSTYITPIDIQVGGAVTISTEAALRVWFSLGEISFRAKN
jgi:hypothetical protein